MEQNMKEILAFREEKSKRREALFSAFHLPIVSFSLNLPGPEKRSPLADFAFRRGVKLGLFAFGKPAHFETLSEKGGSCAFFVVDLPAKELKDRAMDLENSPAGRLFDFDVYDENGEALHRKTPRRCFLCEKPAAECAGRRSHPLSELTGTVNALLTELCAETLSGEAVSALLYEASLTPKPGLVDEDTNGAHADMDLFLLEHSAYALKPYFKNAVLIGLSGGTMEELSENGKAGEQAMFVSTKGINTHKGALYLFSLALYAAGKHLADGSDCFAAVSAIAKQKAPVFGTHGAVVREEYGVGGILAEAEGGFSLARAGYETLSETKNELAALFKIMSLCDDTNLYYRGGAEGLAFVKDEAKKALKLSGEALSRRAKKLDKIFTEKNLSPGGSADLLALSLFLHKERALFFGETDFSEDFFTYFSV